MKVKYLSVKSGVDLSRFPSFHCTGSVTGMKKLYYGKNCLLVRSGEFIYNVSSDPAIYYNLAH